MRVLSWIVVFGALAVGVYGSRALDQGTDPASRRHFWMTPLNEDYTLDLASMIGITQLDNQHLIRFAGEQAHDLVDPAAALPAGAMTFYDDVQFNTAGARSVADVLTDRLLGGAFGIAD